MDGPASFRIRRLCYTSIFSDSKVVAVNKAGGRVMSVTFELEGQPCGTKSACTTSTWCSRV